MSKKQLLSSALLLLTAIIWGFAFVAQKSGMEYIGPFTYSAARFIIGSVCVLGLSLFLDRKKRSAGAVVEHPYFVEKKPNKTLFAAGILCGTCMFGGISLQQAALLYTDAGKCAFITALYMVLVPIISIFLKKKTSLSVWIGVLLAAAGFYFLCLTPGKLSLNFGDLLTLICAFFWAVHILLVDYFVNKSDGIKMAALQYIFTAVLSLIVAVIAETTTPALLLKAALPILYGGLLSVGVAYTLQIIAQKHTPPTLASLLLSLESVFAVAGGAWILHETLSGRETLGCILIFAGVLLAQLPLGILLKFRKKERLQ